MNIILLFLIAISLSMDAFSLSLAYGTLNLPRKEINILSTIVCLYHFFMPILGMYIGEFLITILYINEKIIVLLIFSIIGFNMIFESFKKSETVHRMKKLEIITFGCAVSMDRFSIGIGINNLTSTPIIAALIFMLTSFIFTRLGLVMGVKLNNIFGKYATIFGGLTLIILGICYIL